MRMREIQRWRVYNSGTIYAVASEKHVRQMLLVGRSWRVRLPSGHSSRSKGIGWESERILLLCGGGVEVDEGRGRVANIDSCGGVKLGGFYTRK